VINRRALEQTRFLPSEARAHRRLRKDRPDLHEQVLNGEKTAHAAMVEAGFRKPYVPDPEAELNRLKRAWGKASPEMRIVFYDWIGEQLLR
jgi:hypothetical protein